LQGVKSEDSAGRKRAAVELIARDGAALRKTALRYSLCLDDAEDAYQRTLEILLTKAPEGRPRELARWTQTVVKHEALAIRANRERLLGKAPSTGESGARDRVASIPAAGDGPQERTERNERIARSREALRALKPAELQALTLLAAGYSYAEIGEMTGFSQTKVNRCLAEGRERFREVLSGSESGSRCAELRTLLSAFCDGEVGAAQATVVREHLRACAGCRAAMRAYRAAPATITALIPGGVAALAPSLPASRSLLQRLHELLWSVQSRLPGAGGAADSSVGQVAIAGGTRGAGMAALAKALAVCAGTVGGAAACVATGVAPLPLDLAPAHDRAAKVEHVSQRVVEEATPAEVEYRPAAEPAAQPQPEQKHVEEKSPKPASESESAAAEASAGAVEYAPPPAPAPVEAAPAGESSSASSGSPAGEFGP
jgi:RNA polymerase sigma factor (sigma-70 family)